MPTNQKGVYRFIHSVNYYRNMWSRSMLELEILSTLTPSRVKFKCTYVEQKAFEEIMPIVDHNHLLDYPGFINNLKFILMLEISN